jgi:hypothetical protein
MMCSNDVIDDDRFDGIRWESKAQEENRLRPIEAMCDAKGRR